MGKEKRIFKLKLKNKGEKRIFKIKRIDMMNFKCNIRASVNKSEMLQNAFYDGFLDNYLSENQTPKNYVDDMLVKLQFIKFTIEFNAYSYTPDEIHAMFVNKINIELVFDMLGNNAKMLGKMGMEKTLIDISEIMVCIYEYMDLHHFKNGVKYNTYFAQRRMITLKNTFGKWSALPRKRSGIGLCHRVILDNQIILTSNKDITPSLAYTGSIISVDMGHGYRIDVPYDDYCRLLKMPNFDIEHFCMPYILLEDLDLEDVLDDIYEYGDCTVEHPYTKIIEENFAPLSYTYEKSRIRYANNIAVDAIDAVKGYIDCEISISVMNLCMFNDDGSRIWNPLTRVWVKGTERKVMEIHDFMDKYFSFMNR